MLPDLFWPWLTTLKISVFPNNVLFAKTSLLMNNLRTAESAGVTGLQKQHTDHEMVPSCSCTRLEAIPDQGLSQLSLLHGYHELGLSQVKRTDRKVAILFTYMSQTAV